MPLPSIKKYGILLLTACMAAFCAAADAPVTYGMVAHLNRMSIPEMNRELDMMKKTGFNLVRFDADWNVIEPAPGKRGNYARLDAAVNACRARGMEVMLILPGNFSAHVRLPVQHQAEFLRFVGETVARYRGKVRYYEIFNEVDCAGPWGEKPDPVKYTRLLLATRPVIRANDPDAKVLLSGLSDFNDPFPFWEKMFEAGALAGCDIVNLHPYQMKNFPESRLIRQLSRLRALMRRFGGEKPMWITEIGNSTSPMRQDFIAPVVQAALRKLGFDPEKLTVAVIADDRMMFYTDGVNLRTGDYLPAGVRRREVTFRELATLPVAECPVLALPGSEEFPCSELPHLVDWLRRGGTVIMPGGLPLYFDLTLMDDGYSDRTQVNKKYLASLHLDWFSTWTRPGTPNTLREIAPAPEFAQLRIRQLNSIRFPATGNLHPGDRMIPIVNGFGPNGFQAPIAALYRFDSELKGNWISIPISESCTSSSEEMQAMLLPRTYLVAAGSGAESVSYYRFRAGEFDDGTESHYGIIHRNFTPKPALAAAAELLRMRPPASTPVQLKRIGDGAFRADWRRPDGMTVCAVWAVGHPVKLTIKGNVNAATDYLGNPAAIPPDGRWTVSTGPVYLTPAPVDIHTQH